MALDKLSFPNQNVQGVHGKFSFSAEKSWQLSFLYSSHKLVSSVALARQLDIRIFRETARFQMVFTSQRPKNYITIFEQFCHSKIMQNLTLLNDFM